MAKKKTTTKKTPVQSSNIEVVSEDGYSQFMSFERGVTKTPRFQETWRGGKPWIYQGVDNCYSNEMLRLYQDASGLHTGIIDKKAAMTAGIGFKMDGLSPSAINFIKNKFANEDLNTHAFKCAYDYWIQGGFFLKINWSKTRESIARIEHIPYEKMRIAKPCIGDETEFFYMSRDWENQRRQDNEPIKVQGFSMIEKDEPVQYLFVKRYSPGAEYYATPQYTAVMNWIKLEYEIGVYHLKNIQNNLNSGIIIINKSGLPPTREQREQLYQEIKSRYAGADHSGDILMLFAENKDKAPEIIPMPNNGSDQRFETLINQINQKLILGHQVSSVVAGLETSGKLGNGRDEIEESYNAVQNCSINPAQRIIEATFQKLADINGITDKLELNTFNIFSLEQKQQFNQLVLDIKNK